MSDAVLTFPPEYYRDNFSRRSSLMKEYRENMLTYVKRMFPNVSEEQLKGIINTIIAKEYKSSTLKYIHFPSPGCVEPRSGDLLEVTNERNTDILCPYGASYQSAEINKSLFSEYIEDNQKERKAVKKAMFVAETHGDKATARMCNLKQMNIKININVLSGVMLSNVTFRSAINYNAITATSRFGIMTAYAVVELAMASNYYFYSEDKAINWIVNLLRIYPGGDRFERCLEKYNLAIPSFDKVFSAYSEQVHIYNHLSKNEHLRRLIESLSDNERAFVYYGFNIKRIFQENEHFLTFFNNTIDVDNVELITGDIPKVAKLPDDIIQTAAVISLAADIDSISITDEKTGKVRKATLDDIDEGYPDLARKLYSVYIHIENKFKDLEFLFETLVMLPILPSDITMHKNMIRNSVLLSDTDSILFTNMHWIKWFSGSIRISEQSARFNAIVVSLVSKFLEHVFGYMSASMNIDLINMKTLAIKNEFMYDLFLRTPISKHYAGYVKFREGVLQSPYKFDLKGKNFKGSDLCKETTSYVKWFIKYIFDSFLQTYEIDPHDLILKTIAFEQRIKHSIDDGEVLFLTQKPIQLKQAYKNPESSNYLYYELWQAVFAEKYGDLNLPQKTKDLPIVEVGSGSLYALESVKNSDPDIYNKFVAFIKKYPKKKFSHVLIPMDIPIPSELRAIADYRKVCALNCYSLELILRSFNITNYPNGKKIVLFSDTYQNLVMELTDDHKENIRRAAEEDDFEDFDEAEEDELHDWEEDEF